MCQVMREHAALFHPKGEVVLSRMVGGTTTVPHCGPDDTKIRLHFTLQLPSHTRAEMIVAKQPESWVDGAVLLFDESMEHTVRIAFYHARRGQATARPLRSAPLYMVLDGASRRLLQGHRSNLMLYTSCMRCLVVVLGLLVWLLARIDTLIPFPPACLKVKADTMAAVCCPAPDILALVGLRVTGNI